MQNNQIVNNILSTFQGFQMPKLPIDQFETVGRNILAEKISPFVMENKPINFVMLGFPMKSPNNRDKVLGTMPDLAEEAAFQNFADFNNKIKSIYIPGVNISIVNDGYVFSDIMEVEDRTVSLYKEICMNMSKDSGLSWFDMTDFYDKNLSIGTMRDKVVNQFGITPEELEKRILLDADVNALYRGMIKFMTGDLAIKNFPSNTQLQKQAKIMARTMMFRNEAYSSLVRSEFNNHIRLSMHPSINNGTKYSFQLIKGENIWTSPWHCALAIINGQYATIHKKDAEQLGYELILKNGVPYGYQA